MPGHGGLRTPRPGDTRQKRTSPQRGKFLGPVWGDVTESRPVYKAVVLDSVDPARAGGRALSPRWQARLNERNATHHARFLGHWPRLFNYSEWEPRLRTERVGPPRDFALAHDRGRRTLIPKAFALSLISLTSLPRKSAISATEDRKSTRLNSSHLGIS